MANNKSIDQDELSVQDKLKALYKLQLVTSEIDRIRIIRGELPEEVRDLEDEIEGRHTRYQKDQEEIEDLKRRADAAIKRNCTIEHSVVDQALPASHTWTNERID